MRRTELKAHAARAAAVAVAGASLVACAQVRSAATGECVGDHPITVVMIDGSGTQADDALRDEQLDLVTDVARTTSEACGRLRVERFRASASDVDTLVDRDLTPTGATSATRAKNRPALLDEVRGALQAGVAASPARGGSDPLGAIARGSRLLAQDGRDHKRLVVVTDGVQSHDPNLATADLSAATAARFVDAAGPLPDLSGIDLVVTGVGRVSGAKPPTSYVNGLIAFYSEACRRARAASCQVADALLVPARHAERRRAM
jgi:hypothetical protein